MKNLKKNIASILNVLEEHRFFLYMLMILAASMARINIISIDAAFMAAYILGGIAIVCLLRRAHIDRKALKKA